MNQSDFGQFQALLSDIFAFYRQDYSGFAGRVWWQAMQPFDFKAVSEAFSKHCVNPDTGQYMPKPADVVKMLEGSTQDAGLVAWSKVDQAVRRVGPYSSVVFDDAIIHRVLTEMGGWLELCSKTDDDWPFLRNEFVNRYRGYKMRNEVPEHLPVMIGIAEAQNTKNGFKSHSPALLGNPEKAAQVMHSGSNKSLLQITGAKQFADMKALPKPEDKPGDDKWGEVPF